MQYSTLADHFAEKKFEVINFPFHIVYEKKYINHLPRNDFLKRHREKSFMVNEQTFLSASISHSLVFKTMW